MPTAGATSVIFLEDMAMAIRHHRRALSAHGQSTVRPRRIILLRPQTKAADLLTVVLEGRPMAGAEHLMLVVPLRAVEVEDLPAAIGFPETSQPTRASPGSAKTRLDKDDLLVGPVQTVPERCRDMPEAINPGENPSDFIVNRLDGDLLLDRSLL